MLTEDEAKQKTCPLTLGAPAVYAPSGEGIRSPGPFPCLTSECAAWRWDYRDEIHVPEGMPIPDGYDAFATMTSTCGGVVTKFQVCRLVRHTATMEVIPQRGYCGLAGGRK